MFTLPTIKAWSHSRWGTYEKCPLLAKYKYIDKLKEPEGRALTAGREAHDKLAAFLGGAGMDRQDIPGWEHFGELLVHLRALSPLVEQQWGFTRDWRPTDWFGKDTWFRAVLDAAVVYADNTADIVDHKTGKEYDYHEDQAELYALSLILRYPMTREVCVRFWYLDTGNEVTFEYTRDQALALREKWSKKVEPMLTDTTFAPRPGRHCNWCHFSASNEGLCKFG